MPVLSPLRARMASFDHAYAVAIQRRRETDDHQNIVRTRDPSRPYRVTSCAPLADETLTARVA